MGRHSKGKDAKAIGFNSYKADRDKLEQLQKIYNIKETSEMIRTLINESFEANCAPTALKNRISAKNGEIATCQEILEKTEKIEVSKMNMYIEDYNKVESESRPRNQAERVKAHICWIKYDPRTSILFPGRLPEDIYTELEGRCNK